MSSIHEETHRLPACLWASLQEMCYQLDQKFIHDIAPLIGVNANDIRKKILGVRSEPTVVLVDKDPWWMTSQCSLMERGIGCIWRRCSRPGESNTVCWDHRLYKEPTKTLRRYDDPYFKTLLKRWPVRLENTIVWVCEKGSVLNQHGTIRSDIRIDLRTGMAYITNKM